MEPSKKIEKKKKKNSSIEHCKEINYVRIVKKTGVLLNDPAVIFYMLCNNFF